MILKIDNNNKILSDKKEINKLFNKELFNFDFIKESLQKDFYKTKVLVDYPYLLEYNIQNKTIWLIITKQKNNSSTKIKINKASQEVIKQAKENYKNNISELEIMQKNYNIIKEDLFKEKIRNKFWRV